MTKSQELALMLDDMESMSFESVITKAQYFFYTAEEDYEVAGTITKSICYNLGMADAYLTMAEDMDWDKCSGVRRAWRKTEVYQAYRNARLEEKDWRKD